MSLDELAERLSPLFQLVKNAYLLRFRAENYEITLFADGRAIICGTDDVAVARTMYAKYIGRNSLLSRTTFGRARRGAVGEGCSSQNLLA